MQPNMRLPPRPDQRRRQEAAAQSMQIQTGVSSSQTVMAAVSDANLTDSGASLAAASDAAPWASDVFDCPLLDWPTGPLGADGLWPIEDMAFAVHPQQQQPDFSTSSQPGFSSMQQQHALFSQPQMQTQFQHSMMPSVPQGYPTVSPMHIHMPQPQLPNTALATALAINPSLLRQHQEQLQLQQRRLQDAVLQAAAASVAASGHAATSPLSETTQQSLLSHESPTADGPFQPQAIARTHRALPEPPQDLASASFQQQQFAMQQTHTDWSMVADAFFPSVFPQPPPILNANTPTAFMQSSGAESPTATTPTAMDTASQDTQDRRRRSPAYAMKAVMAAARASASEQDIMDAEMAASAAVAASASCPLKSEPVIAEYVKRRKVAAACTHCKKAHVSCEDARPCRRCIKKGLSDSCIDAPRKPTAAALASNASTSYISPLSVDVNFRRRESTFSSTSTPMMDSDDKMSASDTSNMSPSVPGCGDRFSAFISSNNSCSKSSKSPNSQAKLPPAAARQLMASSTSVARAFAKTCSSCPIRILPKRDAPPSNTATTVASNSGGSSQSQSETTFVDVPGVFSARSSSQRAAGSVAHTAKQSTSEQASQNGFSTDHPNNGHHASVGFPQLMSVLQQLQQIQQEFNASKSQQQESQNGNSAGVSGNSGSFSPSSTSSRDHASKSNRTTRQRQSRKQRSSGDGTLQLTDMVKIEPLTSSVDASCCNDKSSMDCACKSNGRASPSMMDYDASGQNANSSTQNNMDVSQSPQPLSSPSKTASATTLASASQDRLGELETAKYVTVSPLESVLKAQKIETGVASHLMFLVRQLMDRHLQTHGKESNDAGKTESTLSVHVTTYPSLLNTFVPSTPSVVFSAPGIIYTCNTAFSRLVHLDHAMLVSGGFCVYSLMDMSSMVGVLDLALTSVLMKPDAATSMPLVGRSLLLSVQKGLGSASDGWRHDSAKRSSTVMLAAQSSLNLDAQFESTADKKEDRSADESNANHGSAEVSKPWMRPCSMSVWTLRDPHLWIVAQFLPV